MTTALDTTLGVQEQGDIYRFIGTFALASPKGKVSSHASERLHWLQPALQRLDSQHTTNTVQVDLHNAFKEFQNIESGTWAYPRRKDELVPPSGSLEWPIAHHLHNPSFQTLQPHGGETEDATSSCVLMVLARNFVPGKTLIYDHLARRESIDGIEMYPRIILDLHETWLSKIRSSMSAKVEIIYGKKVLKRMRQIYDLEPVSLWDEFEGIVIFLEWDPDCPTFNKTLLRIIVPARHPQVFLSPGGARYGAEQDKVMRLAHALAGLPFQDGFYASFNTAMINCSGIRPHHYESSKKLAVAAQEELARNLAVMETSVKLKPMSRVQFEPKQKDMAQFSLTKVSLKYKRDPSRPSVINVKCKICSLPNKDYAPLWCITSGKYVARRKKCTNKECRGELAIPQDSQLSFVPYSGVPKHGAPESSLDKPVQNHSFSNHRVIQDNLILADPLPILNQQQDRAPLHVSEVLDSPSQSSMRQPRCGYNTREKRNYDQKGETTPCQYWHGRVPVMNKMGRVRIWVLTDASDAAMKVHRLDISTYGPFLLKPDTRILNFNSKGISLVSKDGKELWHKSLKDLSSCKNGDRIVEQHRRELAAQCT